MCDLVACYFSELGDEEENGVVEWYRSASNAGQQARAAI